MRRSIAGAASVVALSCVVLAAAAPMAGPDDLARLARDRGRWIGAADTAAGESSRGSLSRVVSARLTADGRHVVVLDEDAPFVKVFERSGRLRARFLGEGGGPHEMRHPHTVAVSGDRILVLGDVRRVQVYDLDGKPLHDVATDSYRFMNAVEGCDGAWAGYGVAARTARERTSGQDNPWLVSFRIVGDSVVIGPTVFAQAGAPQRMSFGNARGMVSHGGLVVLDHRKVGIPAPGDSDRRLVEWRCGEERPRVRGTNLLFEKFDARPTERVAPGGGQRALGVSIPFGATIPVGLGLAGSAVLFFDDVHQRPAADGSRASVTQLTIVDGAERHRFTIAAGLKPLDSRPGAGILFADSEPYPHLFVITEQELLAALPIRR